MSYLAMAARPAPCRGFTRLSGDGETADQGFSGQWVILVTGEVFD
jgi:hypothetical protein